VLCVHRPLRSVLAEAGSEGRGEQDSPVMNHDGGHLGYVSIKVHGEVVLAASDVR
jgi:hypothetical protein